MAGASAASGPGSALSRSKMPPSALEILPRELVVVVADYLGLGDFQNFRLSSRILAAATRPLLALPSFKGLPWRRDGQRLAQLTRVPDCAARIREVSFNLARIEVEYSVWDQDDPDFARKMATWNEYFKTRAAGRDSRPLDLNVVAKALRRLSHLDSLCLTWTECPWTIADVDMVFCEEDSMEMAGSEILHVQQTILDVLQVTDISLKRLTIEPFVHQRLSIPRQANIQTRRVFGDITQLRLVLEYTEESFKMHQLEAFLALMPVLRELRIHVPPSDWSPSDADLLSHTKLPRLEMLDLSGMHVRLESLATFLFNHANTLKDVRLRTMKGISPAENPSRLGWDTMFFMMHRKLRNLVSVCIFGMFRQYDGGSQLFYAHDDLSWTGAQGSWAMDGSKIEKYILEGGDHPHPDWQPSR